MQSTFDRTKFVIDGLLASNFMGDNTYYSTIGELHITENIIKNRTIYYISNPYNDNKPFNCFEIATTPNNDYLGESFMIEVEYPKRNSVYDLAEALLQFKEVEKILFYQKEKNVKIWVSTVNELSIKSKKMICHYFAEKVDEIFDYEYIINFRINPSDEEKQFIPQEVQTIRRG